MKKKIPFLGIRINPLRREEIVSELLDLAQSPLSSTACYLNAHCVNVASRDQEYREILNQADLVYAGGQGVVWAARFLGKPLPERVNILDFFPDLVRGLKEHKITLYLLGSRAEVVKKAEKALKDLGVLVLGSRQGFFALQEEEEIIREINRLAPDILMVGMGVPAQEKWLARNRAALQVPLCWAVGGFFDVFAGRWQRAPGWVSRGGLEWLWLGLQGPKRLLSRYLPGNIIFIFRALEHKLKNL